MGARAIGVSSYSVAVVYSTSPGGMCEMLPVFREYLAKVCSFKIPQNDDAGNLHYLYQPEHMRKTLMVTIKVHSLYKSFAGECCRTSPTMKHR